MQKITSRASALPLGNVGWNGNCRSPNLVSQRIYFSLWEAVCGPVYFFHKNNRLLPDNQFPIVLDRHGLSPLLPLVIPHSRSSRACLIKCHASCHCFASASAIQKNKDNLLVACPQTPTEHPVPSSLLHPPRASLIFCATRSAGTMNGSGICESAESEVFRPLEIHENVKCGFPTWLLVLLVELPLPTSGLLFLLSPFCWAVCIPLRLDLDR